MFVVLNRLLYKSDKGDSLGQLTDNRCRTQVSRRTRVLCSEDRQVFLLDDKGDSLGQLTDNKCHDGRGSFVVKMDRCFY